MKKMVRKVVKTRRENGSAHQGGSADVSAVTASAIVCRLDRSLARATRRRGEGAWGPAKATSSKFPDWEAAIGVAPFGKPNTKVLGERVPQ